MKRLPGDVQLTVSHYLQSLCLGREYDCANPRDSIYGLLDPAPNDFASIVDPDYNLAIAEVFQHMAVLFILYTNSLALFSATVFRQNNQRSMPTWVADWTKPAEAMTYDDKTCCDEVVWATKRVFNACGQRKLRFELEHDSVATLSGIVLDHVEVITAAITGKDTLDKRRLERHWRSLFDYHTRGTLESFYLGSKSPGSLYWRLLISDIKTTRTGPRRCKVEDREDYTTSASVEEVAANEIARNFHRDLLAEHSRLFFTANGFVGTGPAAMEPGDSYYSLAGAPLPYVLRPVLDAACLNTFELIGSCYVHGVMDG